MTHFGWVRLLWLVLSALPAVAQTTATIVGLVTDMTGAVVAGAKVTATNAGIGLTRIGQSNERGLYVISALPVGEYTISAEKSGFKKTIQPGIVLQVNQEASVNLGLDLGAVTESVTVTGEAPLMQTESASVGQVVDNQFTTEIPLNGRDFSQLILLVPGANDSRSGGGTDLTVGSGVSISGRDNMNNFMFDGASNNARQFGNVAIRPSIDAVQEFKVQSNMYSAEFGQAAFAQINLISKSGTNRMHGSIFEFIRNDMLDARNYFLSTVPQLNRNQFGASVGGPIRHNRTFFFANYEGTRQRRGITSFRTVPLPDWRQGDFSATGLTIRDPSTGQAFPGNRIPANRFNPTALAALKLWAQPNYGSAVINNLVISKPVSLTDDQLTARIDHELTGKDRLSGRYSLFFREQISTPTLPGFEEILPARAQSLVLTETHIFQPALLGEYKFSFVRSLSARTSPNTGKAGYFDQFGIKNFQLPGAAFEGAPAFSFQRITLTGFGDNSYIPLNDISNEFTHAGTLTATRGQHTMKMGASFTKYQQNTPGAVPGFRLGSYVFRGDFTGHAFADFLLGAPYQATRCVGAGVETGRSAWQSYFFQDDWKVTRKLTLNAGVRWEYASPLVDIHDRRSVLYPLTNDYGTGLPGQMIVANSPEARNLLGLDGVGARALYPADRNDLAPRLGFAYNLASRTVLRGGYGIFFANTQNLLNNLVINRRQPPYAETQERISSTTVPEIDLSNPFAGQSTPSVVSTQNISPNLRDGYVQQWNFSVQQELRRDLTLEAGYVANKGTKLSELIYYNVPTPGPSSTVQARRPLPKWGAAMTMDSYVTSNYNSLQAKAQKRFSKGLSFLAAYTWAKAIDLSSERGGGDLARGGDQRNLRGYFRGLSGFDVRHRFVLSYVYELPFGRGRTYGTSLHPVLEGIVGGWEVSGIASFQGGFPFTVLMSGDTNGDGLSADRPNVISKPVIHPGNPACYIEDGRNSACGPNAVTSFGAASPLAFGNAGRNILAGPGLKNWDLGFTRTYRFSERWRLQFRAEFFNLLNNVNFNAPQRNFNLAGFGMVESAGRSREVQFGLKLAF